MRWLGLLILGQLLWSNLFCEAVPAVTAPAYVLEDLTDGTQTEILLDSTKAATVIVFLSSVCPCSQSHEPVLRQMASKYPSVKFYGVVSNSDEDAAQLKEYFGKAALPFPVLHDAKQTLADKLGALKTPHAFVFTKSLEAPVFRGGVDNSHEAERATVHHLKSVLEDLVAGKTPPTREARVVGCAIHR